MFNKLRLSKKYIESIFNINIKRKVEICNMIAEKHLVIFNMIIKRH